MAIPPGEESAVDDFVAHLLYILGYDEPDRVIRQHKDIPFYICGHDSHAKTDVCVMDQTQGILLLVQEDKRHLERADPEAQLVAEAIAAFQTNNRHLVNNMGQPTLQHATIPGISMVGTVPTFYKVHIRPRLWMLSKLVSTHLKPRLYIASGRPSCVRRDSWRRACDRWIIERSSSNASKLSGSLCRHACTGMPQPRVVIEFCA